MKKRNRYCKSWILILMTLFMALELILPLSGAELSKSTVMKPYSGAEPVPVCLSANVYGMVRGQKWKSGTDWSSSSPSVVKPGKKGLLSAKREGMAELYGNDGRQIKVWVVRPRLSRKKIRLLTGDTALLQLKYDGTDMDRLGFRVDWASSNTDVVQVVSGNLAATGPGRAVVTALVCGRKYRARISVKNASGRTVVMNVPQGGRKKLKFRKPKQLRWTVSSEEIHMKAASVLGLKAGRTEAAGIRFSRNSVSVSQNETDTARLIAYVGDSELDTSYGLLKTGKRRYSLFLKRKQRFALNFPTQHSWPVWKSKNPSTAAVSAWGVVVAENAGRTILKTKVNNQTVRVDVTVSESEGSPEDYDSPFEKRLPLMDAVNGHRGYDLYMKHNGDYYLEERLSLSGSQEEKSCFRVVFDTEGGLPEIPPREVRKGEKVSRPDDPVREGTEFRYWSLEGRPYGFGEPVEQDLLLTAVYSDTETYPVRFSDSLTGFEKEIQVVRGGRAVPPETETREDAVFVSWQLDGKDFDFSQRIYGPLFLEARWERLRKVTFYLEEPDEPQGGSGDTAGETGSGGNPEENAGVYRIVEVREGEAVSLPEAPERAGSDFAGWFFNGTEYDSSRPVTEDLNLFAHWDEWYSVVFETGEEESRILQKVYLNGDRKVKRPEDPVSQDGKEFYAWMDETGVPYDFNASVTGDMTLYASWQKRRYYAVFHYPDGKTEKILSGEDGSVDMPETPEAAECVPEGEDPEHYYFAGWYYRDPFGRDRRFDPKESRPGTDLELYPRYMKKIRLIWLGNGGRPLAQHAYVTPLETAPDPQIPVREGYAFAGWESAGKETGDSSRPEKDTVYRARWKRAFGYVRVQIGDRILSLPLNEEGMVYPSCIPADPSPEEGQVELGEGETYGDYGFMGWKQPGNDGELKDFDFRTNAPVPGKLILPSFGRLCTVTFFNTPGTEIPSQRVRQGDRAERPEDPVRKEYFFEKWVHGGEEYDFEAPVTKDLSLYARWRYRSASVTIRYPDGRTEVISVGPDGRVMLPDPEDMEGYRFAGWEKLMEDGTRLPFDPEKDRVEGDIVLYPVYTEACVIHFVTRGGILPADRKEFEKVDTGAVLGALPVIPDWIGAGTENRIFRFTGWYTAPEGGSRAEEGMRVLHDLTLYARYEETERRILKTWDEKEAGCTEPGSVRVRYSDGLEETCITSPALGHDYGHYTSPEEGEPVFFNDGTGAYLYRCGRCGEEFMVWEDGSIHTFSSLKLRYRFSADSCFSGREGDAGAGPEEIEAGRAYAVRFLKLHEVRQGLYRPEEGSLLPEYASPDGLHPLTGPWPENRLSEISTSGLGLEWKNENGKTILTPEGLLYPVPGGASGGELTVEIRLQLNRLPYRFEHRYEKTSGTGYETEEERGLALPGSILTPPLRERPGYASPSPVSYTLQDREKTDPEIPLLGVYRYERKDYSLRFDPRGGSSVSPGQKRLKYGAPYGALPETRRTGYVFDGWRLNSPEGEKVNQESIFLESGDTLLAAAWIPVENTPYRVRHLLMDPDGENYTLYEEQELAGTTGDKVTPEVLSLTGFTSPSPVEVLIAGDGSTVVTYMYTRNRYRFTLNGAQGASTAGSTGTGSYYYGTNIILKGTAASGYTWAGWTGLPAGVPNTQSTSFEMPAMDVTVTPRVTAAVTAKTLTVHYMPKAVLEYTGSDGVRHTMGSSGGKQTVQVKPGTAVTIRSSYGNSTKWYWNNSNTGKKALTCSFTMPSANVSFYLLEIYDDIVCQNFSDASGITLNSLSFQ